MSCKKCNKDGDYMNDICSSCYYNNQLENEYFVYIQGLSSGRSIIFKCKNGNEAMLLAIKEGKKDYGNNFVIKTINKL